jgi:hypothetical protein
MLDENFIDLPHDMISYSSWFGSRIVCSVLKNRLSMSICTIPLIR